MNLAALLFWRAKKSAAADHRRPTAVGGTVRGDCRPAGVGGSVRFAPCRASPEVIAAAIKCADAELALHDQVSAKLRLRDPMDAASGASAADVAKARWNAENRCQELYLHLLAAMEAYRRARKEGGS